MSPTGCHRESPSLLFEESQHTAGASEMATGHILKDQAKPLMRDPSNGFRYFSWARDSLGAEAREDEHSTVLPASIGGRGIGADQKKTSVQASRSINGAKRLIFFKYSPTCFSWQQKPAQKSLTTSGVPWHAHLDGEMTAGREEGHTGKPEAHFPLQAPIVWSCAVLGLPGCSHDSWFFE